MTDQQDVDADRTIEQIRQAASALDDIDAVSLAEAAGRFDHLHSELQAALSELDRA